MVNVIIPLMGRYPGDPLFIENMEYMNVRLCDLALGVLSRAPEVSTVTVVVSTANLSCEALVFRLKKILPNVRVTRVNCDFPTSGAVASTLYGLGGIEDSDEPLVVMSLDCYLSFDFGDVVRRWVDSEAICGMLSVTATDPTLSYVKLSEDGRLIDIAEGRKISNQANAGIYYFKDAPAFNGLAYEVLSSCSSSGRRIYLSDLVKFCLVLYGESSITVLTDSVSSYEKFRGADQFFKFVDYKLEEMFSERSRCILQRVLSGLDSEEYLPFRIDWGETQMDIRPFNDSQKLQIMKVSDDVVEVIFSQGKTHLLHRDGLGLRYLGEY